MFTNHSHKNRKAMRSCRWVAVLLTVCMLFSVMSPLIVNAANENTQTDGSSLQLPESYLQSELGSELSSSELFEEQLTADNLPFAMTLTEAVSEGFVSRIKDAEADLYSVVFKNEDDSLTLYYYDQPVKYINEYGVICDKSDLLYAYKDGSFGTLSSDILTDFPKLLKDGISLYKDEVSLHMTPTDETAAIGTLSSDQKVVTYALNNTTRYEYSLTAMGFKENIVVSEYTGRTEYSFVLKTNGLTPVEDNGTYVLVDKDGTVQASISDIIIFTADERNNTRGGLSIEEVIAGEEYRLTISVDSEWLADAKTAYPITIDPSVTLNTTGQIEDVVVGTSTTYSGTSGSLYVGRGSSGAQIRALMRFPKLSISGYTVTSARIELRDLMCEDEAQTVECHEYVGNSWSESGSTSWSSIGSSPVGTLLSSKSVKYGNGDKATTGNSHRYAFDITSLAKKWASGSASPSKGVIFKATDSYETSGTKTFKTFASINRGSYEPSLVVNYSSTSTPTITLSQSSISVYVGGTAWLSATASNGAAVSYSSGNSSIATVSGSGYITGMAAGTTTITVSASGAASKYCTVTVSSVGLSLNKSSVTLVPGETVQLTATTTPSGRTVTWSTSNSSVATVSSGKVTAKAVGTATITASTSGATSVKCTVTVSNDSYSVNFNIDKCMFSKTDGTTYTYFENYVSVYPASAKSNLRYEVYNSPETVAAFWVNNTTGQVLAYHSGFAILKVYFVDKPSVYDICFLYANYSFYMEPMTPYYFVEKTSGRFLRYYSNSLLSTASYVNSGDFKWEFIPVSESNNLIHNGSSSVNQSAYLYCDDNGNLSYKTLAPDQIMTANEHYQWYVSVNGIKNIATGYYLVRNSSGTVSTSKSNSSTWAYCKCASYVPLTSFEFVKEAKLGKATSIGIETVPSNATFCANMFFSYSSSNSANLNFPSTGTLKGYETGEYTVTLTHKGTNISTSQKVTVSFDEGIYSFQSTDGKNAMDLSSVDNQGVELNGKRANYSEAEFGRELWEVKDVAGGNYSILSLWRRSSTYHPDMALKVSGTTVGIATYQNSSAFKWKIHYNSDGSYYLINGTQKLQNTTNTFKMGTTGTAFKLVSGTALGLPNTVFNMKYPQKTANGINFVVKVDSSALKGKVTTDLIKQCVESWNGTNPNVKLYMYTNAPSNVLNNACEITIKYKSDNSNILGQTCWLDKNGSTINNPIQSTAEIGRIEIFLYNSLYDSNNTNDYKKTITHEIGHALGLRHPHEIGFADYTQSQTVLAVMNQGTVSATTNGQVCQSPSGLDKFYLSKKWGT